MAEIQAFPGIHYDPERVSLAKVIAPPYDVLSPVQQDVFYALHPDNIVRLILNREQPDDTETHNRYSRAARFLQDRLVHGVLVQDETPALYEYIQRFEHPLEPSRLVERSTLFVALKLEPYENGVVLPHEETHPRAKADRLNLMRATRSNPEPIYGLYEDPDQALARTLEMTHKEMEPLLTATFDGKVGPDREQHLVYRHTDSRLIANISRFLAPRRVWIADGHHRYETALNYQQERKAVGKSAALQPYDYLLIGLSAFEDPGIVVLPTHRLVRNLSTERMEALSPQLERYFAVQEMTTAEIQAWIKKESVEQKRFAVVTRERSYALTLRDFTQAEAAMDRSHCEAWRRLDVTILQTLVLDRTLGISWKDLAHTSDVAYTRDEKEAFQKVEAGEFQLACLLQNPNAKEVRAVASAGDKMPQKSTFFYPKLWSGLILRSLE